MIKGVLLDIDGTLVLSNDAHAKAWVEAFAMHGYQIDFGSVRKLIGMGSDQLIPKLIPHLGAEDGIGKKITEQRSKLFIDKYAPALKPAPGAEDLIGKFISEGLKITVATSAQKEELKVILKAGNIIELINKSTSASDVENSKPAPDIVGAALDKISLPAPDVVMLGDTPYDIEAAGKCGVGVIALRCGGFPDHLLKNALAIYNDPADLLKNYNSSLFATV